MRLHDIYDPPKLWHIPYLLLEEREPQQNISHKRMPTWDEHCLFVASRPYAAWYVIQSDKGHNVGAAYLTRQREVGIGILRGYRGNGFGEQAVAQLMEAHPGRFLANIAPGNDASLMLFRKLGFGGPAQVTLEKPE